MSMSRYGFIILIAIILLGRYTGLDIVGRVIVPLVQGLGSLLGVPL
jgi:hypothetical protein